MELDSRNKILYSALELFANQGYEKTSTREIAKKANVNLSSIKYYFGDKAGLYKATYHEPMSYAKENVAVENDTLENTLKVIFTNLISPLKASEHIKLCIKLHMREIVEPSGLWESNTKLKSYHSLLVKSLKKEFGSADINNIQRLAFSILSLGVFLYIGQDMITQIKPKLINNHKNLDIWTERLVMYAKVMIEAEKKIGKINE